MNHPHLDVDRHLTDVSDIFYLILRRLRTPLVVVIILYTVAIVVMTFIPGKTPDGEVWYMSVFEAFYWISYTATTIGFGEVPYEFSEAQRMWVLVSIYLTVPGWLYAVGKIIALLGDATFQQALREYMFTRAVSQINDRFCIICGYGEAGKRLSHLLMAYEYQCVVIEKDETRVHKMVLDVQSQNVIAVPGNAADLDNLLRAGILSPHCKAIIALTDQDEVNIKIALAAKILKDNRDHADFKVICRTATMEASTNAKSFHTDFVINSNQLFAERLVLSMRRPAIATLTHCFLSEPLTRIHPQMLLPRGSWIIAGYNEFCLTMQRYLMFEGVDTIFIHPEADDAAEDEVRGSGQEAVDLRQACIHQAQGIVAGTEVDASNLSIIMTSKRMVPNLFSVGKLNQSSNLDLFRMAGFDEIMEEDEILVSEILPIIARPFMSRFMLLMRRQSEEWGQKLLARLNDLEEGRTPYNMLVRIDDRHAPTVMEELRENRILRLQNLWTMTAQPASVHDVVPLLLVRQQKDVLLPKPAMTIQKNDTILLAFYDPAISRRIQRNLHDAGELYYAIHGKEMARSHVVRWMMKHLKQ